MEFANLQPVSLNNELQGQMRIETAADLSHIFSNQSNAGDQVEMFFAIAESHPENALTAFGTVVRNLTSQPIRALALQGFGKIPPPFKQALASCISQESQDLLQLLCSLIRNRSSDLITWASVAAIQELSFSLENIQHPQGGNLSESPRRIQNEVLDRKIREINTINRLNTRGQFTAEYERFLEFWIYGPTSELFNEVSASQKYIEIVRDVLNFTQLRGVQLGLDSTNQKVQEEAFNHAKATFKRYSETQDDAFKRRLGDGLKRFLKETSSEDAHLAKLAEAFNFELQMQMQPIEQDLPRQCISEIESKIDKLEGYCSHISSIFLSAMNLSGSSNLKHILERNKNIYVEIAESWLDRLSKQIDKLEALFDEQNSNLRLLFYVIHSIYNYDYEAHNRLQGKISSEIEKEISLEYTTQEQFYELKHFLTTTKDYVSLFISERLRELKSEVRELEKAINKRENTTTTTTTSHSSREPGCLGQIGCAVVFWLFAGVASTIGFLNTIYIILGILFLIFVAFVFILEQEGKKEKEEKEKNERRKRLLEEQIHNLSNSQEMLLNQWKNLKN